MEQVLLLPAVGCDRIHHVGNPVQQANKTPKRIPIQFSSPFYRFDMEIGLTSPNIPNQFFSIAFFRSAIPHFGITHRFFFLLDATVNNDRHPPPPFENALGDHLTFGIMVAITRGNICSPLETLTHIRKADKQLPVAVCHQPQQRPGPQKVQTGQNQVPQEFAPTAAAPAETILDYGPIFQDGGRVLAG